MKESVYDNIANHYDDRFKTEKYDGIISEINSIITANNFSRVIEVGCGTGYWLRNIKNGNILKTGIDISQNMLSVAKRKVNDSSFVCADAVNLPLKEKTFQAVFLINVLHQIKNWRKVLADIKTILDENGKFVVIGIFPDEPEFHWYVYDYFPKLKERDLARYQTKKEIVSSLSEYGFKNIKIGKVHSIEKTFLGQEVLSDPFLQKHNSSQLARLGETAYKAGLLKINEDILRAENERKTIRFKSKIIFHSIIADA